MRMKNEDRLRAMMNKNIKMSPLLIAFVWDVWFVWTISTMYLSQVKGFSYSEIVLLDSVLMGTGAISCLLVGKFFKKMSSVWALRIGLAAYGVFLLTYIFATQYYIFIIVQAALSFGYAMCGIKSNAFLNDSLTLVKRNKDYDKVSGAGNSIYYAAQCIGAILITYIYNWNPIMSFWVSFGVIIIAELFTLLATDTGKIMKRNVSVSAKVKTISLKKKKALSKEIWGSFVISVLLFSFFMRGAHAITMSAYKIFLQQSQDAGLIKPWLFGYLYALARISMAIASKFQFKFDLKYGIKTVVVLVIIMTGSLFFLGILNLLIPGTYTCLVITIIISCILIATRPPLQIIASKYINKFVSQDNIDKAFSRRMTAEYLGYTLFSFIFSRLLVVFNDSYAMSNLIFSIIVFIPLLASCIFYLACLFKRYNKLQTIIKKEYTEE